MSVFDYLPQGWLWLLVGGFLSYMCVLGVKFVRHRRLYKDLPTPPHSMLLGNLSVMGDYGKRFPADCHPQSLFTEMAKDHGFRGLYYLDLYPFAEPMVFVLDSAVAAQTDRFSRHQVAHDLLGRMLGEKSIFSLEDAEWRAQHSWFAPAFSLQHLMTLVPSMVEETLIFREKMTKYAVTGQRFSMNEEAMRLAIDIIARTGLDLRLGSQTQDSRLVAAFDGCIGWTAGITEPLYKKILSPFMMTWHRWTLDDILGKFVRERYGSDMDDKGTKTIVDLACRGYLKESGKMGTSGQGNLDSEFVKVAVDNAITFLAGGHDTTASLVTYAHYLLSLHPDILERVRQEHDEVFGPDLETTMQLLKDEPQRLNKISLTAAVLKETLRLFPAGFTARKGPPGSTLTFEGRAYPVENHMICILNAAMHRDETLWENPYEFNPDRFSSPTKAATDAWQPFSTGPRRCIGQQLALLEAKVICVLTLRWFDFQHAIHPEGPSIPGWGGRAYQELKMSAKPKDGIPMTVKLRSQ